MRTPLKKPISTDVPGPPGKPVISNPTKSNMIVTWDRPHSDGGSEIIGYFVERHHKKGFNWVRLVSQSFLIKNATSRNEQKNSQ